MNWFFRKLYRYLSRRPEVSIIIPVYNKVEFLPKCLDSILRQNDVDFEVICVNDASTDGSLAILEAYSTLENRIIVKKNRQNIGPGMSRNVGIKAARGKYIQFADADDIIPDGSIKKLIDAMERNDVKVVRGGVEGLKGREKIPIPDQAFSGKKGPLEELPEIWNCWYHTTYLIKKDLLLSSSIRYPDIRFGEDPVFIARVLTSVDVVCIIPDIVYLHRIGIPNHEITDRDIKDYLSHVSMVREIFLPDHPQCWRYYKEFNSRKVRMFERMAHVPPKSRDD